MPTFTFSKTNRIIQVNLPDTRVTVQQLINVIRDWEDELANLETPKVADASGKEDLGGGLAIGITLKLLNWKIKFADRSEPDYVDCEIAEGNLIAVDQNGVSINPIQPSAYVTVTRSVAVSGVRIADVAEWTQSQKDQVFSDIDNTKAEVLETQVQVQAAKEKSGGSYDRDIMSLEAIREKLDKLVVTGGKGFSV